MKTKKHLFNGYIEQNEGIFAAYDSKGKYLTYGKTENECMVEVHSYLKKLFPSTPFVTEYYSKVGRKNFSAFKRGRQ